MREAIQALAVRENTWSPHSGFEISTPFIYRSGILSADRRKRWRQAAISAAERLADAPRSGGASCLHAGANLRRCCDDLRETVG
jgi:hypothetical protein